MVLMELRIINRQRTRKSLNIWKLSNIYKHSQLVKKRIREELEKILNHVTRICSIIKIMRYLKIIFVGKSYN